MIKVIQRRGGKPWRSFYVKDSKKIHDYYLMEGLGYEYTTEVREIK